MQLVRPSAEHLPSYVAALERGWSHDNERGAAARPARTAGRKCGGVLHETFTKPAQFATRSALRYRIYLVATQAPD